MTTRRTIGEWRGVTFEVAAWDGSRAEVDLSCACMFARELGADGPAGGLLHLDQALGGALAALRREGYFRADAMQTLLIDRPPATIAARAVLVVGMGEPQAWTPALTAQAAATAVYAAMQRRAQSAAFAPSVLDTGIASPAAAGMPAAMLRAVAVAIDTQFRLAALGLASPLSLQRWVFDVGAARLEGAAQSFAAELAAVTSDWIAPDRI